MSISTTLRTAGPFSGDDATLAFPFAFKVFETTDLLVKRTDDDGTNHLTLGSDYRVSLNSDQDANPGGTVSLSRALAQGETLDIVSAIAATQPVQILNQGGFYPKVITNALDRLTILVQQITAGVVSITSVLLESLSTSTITAIGDSGVKVAGVTCKDGSVTLTGSINVSIPVAGGSANALSASYSPAITELVDGLVLMVRAAHASTASSLSFSPNAGVILAKNIVKGAGADLEAGDVIGAGHTLVLRYDKKMDSWVLMNPGTSLSVVTTTNDPEASNSSPRPASTAWVRSSMSSIATAAGFLYSWGTGGYIRFPGWLGSFLIQWNYVPLAEVSTELDLGYQSFALAFPNSLFAVIPVVISGNTAGLSESFAVVYGPTKTSFGLMYGSGVVGSRSIGAYWIAIGR